MVHIEWRSKVTRRMYAEDVQSPPRPYLVNIGNMVLSTPQEAAELGKALIVAYREPLSSWVSGKRLDIPVMWNVSLYLFVHSKTKKPCVCVQRYFGRRLWKFYLGREGELLEAIHALAHLVKHPEYTAWCRRVEQFQHDNVGGRRRELRNKEGQAGQREIEQLGIKRGITKGQFGRPAMRRSA